MTRTMIKENSNASSNHGVIEKMVHGYATQDLEAIMPLFADDAVYRDMAGGGIFGKTLRGKAAIRKHFSFYFRYLMPSHTYEDAVIFAEGNRVSADWTLVLGSQLSPARQFRVRGCDSFIVENGKVKEKCAFLKSGSGTYWAMAKIRLIEALTFSTAGARAGMARQ